MKRLVNAVALLVLVGLWSVLSSSAASTATATLANTGPGSDLIVARGFLEDPQGLLRIDEVVNREFTGFERPLALGYTDSVIWVRVDLRAPMRGNNAVLRLYPSNLDEVHLFEAGNYGWHSRATGDRQPHSGRDLASYTLGFALSLTSPTSTVYLRLKTSSAMQLGLEALAPLMAVQRDHQIDQLQVLFLSFMLVGLAWAVQHYLIDRDPVIGLFALYQVAFMLYELALLGYLADIPPDDRPTWADQGTNVLVCTWPFVSTLLSAALLRRYQPPRPWLIGSVILLLTYPVELALLGAGHAREALALNASVTVIARVYFWGMALAARTDGLPSRRFVRWVLGVMAVMALFIIPSELGWMVMPYNNLRKMYYMFAFGVVSSSLLVMLVRSRLLENQRLAQQSLVDLALSRQSLALERHHKEEAQTLAHVDFLTGLLNRRRFVELGEQAIAQATPPGQALAVIMIDLDHFKSLNDSMGHGTGDLVLQRVAHLIEGALRADDLLGRIGGEEFAAVLVNTDAEQAMEAARRMRAAVADAPFELAGGRRVQVTVSLGLTMLRDRNSSLSQLLNEADQALYIAKTSGRDALRLYDEEISARAHLRAQLIQELSNALAAGELDVEYQPIFDAINGLPLGAEALLRWRHPRLGLVPPEAFVDVAEETGLILPIGAWVLHSACREAMRWPAQLKVSVNLSVRQLHSRNIVQEVHDALAQSGLPAHRLELEITESSLAQEAMAADTLDALRRLGVSLALDDFGTGFSSLAYLQRFPFDRLKIDRAFVLPLQGTDNTAPLALVRAVIELARALNLKCTAEGIESIQQLQLLRTLGCNAVQGFHLARPMSSAALHSFLDTWHRPTVALREPS